MKRYPLAVTASIFFSLIANAGAEPAAKKAPAPVPSPAATAAPSSALDRTKFYGEPVFDESGKLKFVQENKSQTYAKDEFVWVVVKNIDKKEAGKEIGRVRVAVWDSSDTYGKEGVSPFRASSYFTKDAQNKEMRFKIAGLTKGKNYSFFAHNDSDNNGKVNRNFFRIPTEQYIFSNAKNQGKGPGLTREGFGPPSFRNTLVSYTKAGQEIVLSF